MLGALIAGAGSALEAGSKHLWMLVLGRLIAGGEPRVYRTAGRRLSLIMLS